jgi:hypothetical protein
MYFPSRCEKRRLDRAVCRDASIGEWGGLDRVEVADGCEKPGFGDQYVRRVSSVVTHSGSADSLLIETMILFTSPLF